MNDAPPKYYTPPYIPPAIPSAGPRDEAQTSVVRGTRYRDRSIAFGHASLLEFFDIRLPGDPREALLSPTRHPKGDTFSVIRPGREDLERLHEREPRVPLLLNSSFIPHPSSLIPLPHPSSFIPHPSSFILSRGGQWQAEGRGDRDCFARNGPRTTDKGQRRHGTDNGPLTTPLLPPCSKARVTRQVGGLGQAEPTETHRRGACSARDDVPRSRRFLGFHAWPRLF